MASAAALKPPGFKPAPTFKPPLGLSLKFSLLRLLLFFPSQDMRPFCLNDLLMGGKAKPIGSSLLLLHDLEHRVSQIG